MATIESRDFTLEKLFNDFYVVLDYQREYVWKEEHVKAFIEDIYSEFSSNKSDSAYFIGSIIVCVRDNNVYELIDGQQRMTTAFLVLCAIRDYRKENNPDESIDALKNLIVSTYTDDEGNDKSRNRVELQYEDSRGILEKIALQEKYDEIPETGSVHNLKIAYNTILDFLDDNKKFGQDELGIQKIKKFYAYFIKNVKAVRVETQSMAYALTVFATINNRGVGLDAMDLLKNLMFMQVKDREFEKLKTIWKKMVDTLFEADEKPLRFLRYFILARYDAEERLREDRIYDWFDENKVKCGYSTKPIEFVENLLKAARAFVNFKKGKDAIGKPNRYLTNIVYFSTTQHLMLLLAGQHLPIELFTELCRHIENLLFAYIITREGTNKLEKLFTLWTAKLRQVQDNESLDKFIAEDVQVAKQQLAERFELAFRQMDESYVRKKITMQYTLAKLTQYIDEPAWGSNESAVDLKTYINRQVEIEHILPQNPTDAIKSSFDKPNEIKDYIQRLGNLTLLERPINAAIGNKSFEIKKDSYPKSKFLLTRSIPKQVSVGVDTAIDRAVKDLKSFEEWNSTSIEARQEMLTQLAKKVWDMP